MDYQFRLDFKVRDYECDLQGVVNNSVYQNYLEHTRHEFLLACGIDFAELARQQINLVVVRAELEYKSPLTSGDEFWVGLNTQRTSRLKFAFLQDIYHKDEDRLILNAQITGVALDKQGRPFAPDMLATAIS